MKEWLKKFSRKPSRGAECPAEREPGEFPRVLSRPRYVHLAVSRACNLDCIMCPVGRETLEGKKKFLGMETFNRILSDGLDFNFLNFIGTGEVFVARDFEAMLRACFARGFNDLGCTTNLQLLTEETARMMVEKGFQQLTVSIDGCTRETFERIRRGSSFEKTIRIIEHIQKLKKEYGTDRPELTVAAVAMNSSIGELPGLVELAHRLGIKNILVSRLLVSKPEILAESPFFEPERYNEYHRRATRLSRKLGILLEMPPPFGLPPQRMEKMVQDCRKPFEEMHIDVDGIAYPCACWVVPEMSIGNLNQENLSAVWRSERFERFRREMHSDHPPKQCVECTFSVRDQNQMESHMTPELAREVREGNIKIESRTPSSSRNFLNWKRSRADQQRTDDRRYHRIGRWRADKHRYLDLETESSGPAEVVLTFKKDGNTFQTRHFPLPQGRKISRFDLTCTRAKDKNRVKNYFWSGEIEEMSIKIMGNSVIRKVDSRKTVGGLGGQDDKVVWQIDYPEIAHLEVTRNCNIQCYMCRSNRVEELNNIGRANIDPGVIEKLVPFLSNVGTIALFGWGEPFCHPQFERILQAIGKIKAGYEHPGLYGHEHRLVHPISIITTNGTLLSDQNIHLLIENGLDHLRVSLDSLDRENFNFIRKGADFDQVLNNLKRLERIKAELGVDYPKLGFQFVAMERNIRELPEMVRFAAGMKAFWLTVEYLVVSTKGLENESLFYHQDLANRYFREAEKLARELKLSIGLPPRFGEKIERLGYCDDLPKYFYVQAEGTVLPCCTATNMIIGDINLEPPEKIWLGEARSRLIVSLARGDVQGQCAQCIKYTGHEIGAREMHIRV